MPGPLDLASMKISRGKSNDTVAFSAHGAVSNTAIDPSNGNFVILIDVNDDRDYDYGQYVFFAAGKLRGTLVNLATNNLVDRTVPTSQDRRQGLPPGDPAGQDPQPRDLSFRRVRLLPGRHRAPSSIRASTRSPTATPLIPLDHRAPSSAWDSWETYSGDASDDLTSPVRVPLRRRPVRHGRQGVGTCSGGTGGGHSWATVEDGQGPDADRRRAGDEGSTYDLRTIVVDRQKNRKISTLQAHDVPIRRRRGDLRPRGHPGCGGHRLVPGHPERDLERCPAWHGDLHVHGGHRHAGVRHGWPGGFGHRDGGRVARRRPAAADDRGRLRPGAQPHPVLRDGQRQSRTRCSSTGTSASTFWIDGFYVVP